MALEILLAVYVSIVVAPVAGGVEFLVCSISIVECIDIFTGRRKPSLLKKKQLLLTYFEIRSRLIFICKSFNVLIDSSFILFLLHKTLPIVPSLSWY